LVCYRSIKEEKTYTGRCAALPGSPNVIGEPRAIEHAERRFPACSYAGRAAGHTAWLRRGKEKGWSKQCFLHATRKRSALIGRQGAGHRRAALWTGRSQRTGSIRRGDRKRTVGRSLRMLSELGGSSELVTEPTLPAAPALLKVTNRRTRRHNVRLPEVAPLRPRPPRGAEGLTLP